MSKPTLLLKGFLKDPERNTTKQKELDEWIPLDYIMEWIKERLSKNGISERVLVLKASVGSGKSIGMPAELYMRFVQKSTDKKGILISQPRILTTIANIKEIANIFKNLKLGVDIGWSTGSNKLPVKSDRLNSVVLQTLQSYFLTMTDDEIMNKWKYIIIDECHERTIALDMTLFLIKKFLQRNAKNPNCPFLILASGTMDEKLYLDYFGCSNNNLILVEGFAFGRDEIWFEGKSSNYFKSACEIVEHIMDVGKNDESGKGDILIFMPGGAEMNRTKDLLLDMNAKRHLDGKSIVSVLLIDRPAVVEESRDYRMLNAPLSSQMIKMGDEWIKPERKVFVCSVIAETGLTIPTLKYVIDSGYNRGTEYNPTLNLNILITKPAPQSRIIQRMGRCGRKFKGVFYSLYSKQVFNSLQVQQYPEIITEDLSPVFLKLVYEQLEFKKRMGQPEIFKIEDTDLITMPTSDMLQICIEKAYVLGFLDILSNQLTNFGRIAQKINLQMETLRMILAGYNWGCSILDLISMGVYIQKKESDYQQGNEPIKWVEIYKLGLPSYLHNESNKNIYRERLLIADTFIDGCAIINAMGEQLKKHDSIIKFQAWCLEVNLDYNAILEFIEARDTLIEQFIMAEFDINKNETYSLKNSLDVDLQTTIRKIKHCIMDGYRLNMLEYVDGCYKVKGYDIQTPDLFADIKQNRVNLDDNNIVSDFRPQHILYHKLYSTINQKTGIYRIKTQHISIMDGYTHPDNDFV
jgi:HrpA-like RNA helicase